MSANPDNFAYRYETYESMTELVSLSSIPTDSTGLFEQYEPITANEAEYDTEELADEYCNLYLVPA